jgi:DMSO/TMAO reductase YedYZ heme-binding membrane subunit
MLRGWALVAWTALCVGAVVGVLVVADPGEPGLRAGIRFTARTSVSLFLLAFSASAINALWRGALGRWLLANRRYLGVSFAVSHVVHLGLVGALSRTAAALDLSGVPFGVVAYAFIAAMTITSFDGPARALGRRRWKLLHTTGAYVLWAIFTFNYARRVPDAPAYAPVAAAALAALGLRIAARLRRRRNAR